MIYCTPSITSPGKVSSMLHRIYSNLRIFGLAVLSVIFIVIFLKEATEFPWKWNRPYKIQVGDTTAEV